MKEHNLDMCVRFSSNLTLCGAGAYHSFGRTVIRMMIIGIWEGRYVWAHAARKDEPASEMIDEILIKWILRENAIVRKGWWLNLRLGLHNWNVCAKKSTASQDNILVNAVQFQEENQTEFYKSFVWPKVDQSSRLKKNV